MGDSSEAKKRGACIFFIIRVTSIKSVLLSLEGAYASIFCSADGLFILNIITRGFLKTYTFLNKHVICTGIECVGEMQWAYQQSYWQEYSLPLPLAFIFYFPPLVLV